MGVEGLARQTTEHPIYIALLLPIKFHTQCMLGLTDAQYMNYLATTANTLSQLFTTLFMFSFTETVPMDAHCDIYMHATHITLSVM